MKYLMLITMLLGFILSFMSMFISMLIGEALMMIIFAFLSCLLAVEIKKEGAYIDES